MSFDPELSLRALRALQRDPELSQRALARELGLALSKTHYIVQALVSAGWVRAQALKNSRDRRAYLYVLTPRGLKEKARLTRSFLQRKEAEYEALKVELAALREEVANTEPS